VKTIKSYKSFKKKKPVADDEVLDIIDTLQGEIFDQLNIVKATEEQSENWENEPEHKYWEISYDYEKNPQIFICNLNRKEALFVVKELKEIESIVEGRTGLKYEVDTSIDGKSVNGLTGPLWVNRYVVIIKPFR
jgi:hypothetical protein